MLSATRPRRSLTSGGRSSSGPGSPTRTTFSRAGSPGSAAGPKRRHTSRTALRLSPGAVSPHAISSWIFARRSATRRAPRPSPAKRSRPTPRTPGRGPTPKAAFLPRSAPTPRRAARPGIALGQKGDFVASALAYRAALHLQPADADALNNLGWTLGKLGYFAQAVPPLEKALAIRPDFTLARNNLAWVTSQLDELTVAGALPRLRSAAPRLSRRSPAG